MKFRQILPEEKLRALPTKRLKAYLRTVNECRGQENWDLQDQLWDGTAPSFPSHPNAELTKRNPTWRKLHDLITSIMNTREHVGKNA